MGEVRSLGCLVYECDLDGLAVHHHETTKERLPCPASCVGDERAVLGSLLLVNDHIDHVIDTISADEFYSRAHRILYQTILDLYKRGEAVDFLSLQDELQRRGDLELVGGVEYVAGLTDNVPAAANVRFYAKAVQGTHRRRQLQRLALELGTAAANGQNIDSIIEAHLADLEGLRGGSSGLRLVPMAGRLTGPRTGCRRLAGCRGDGCDPRSAVSGVGVAD